MKSPIRPSAIIDSIATTAYIASMPTLTIRNLPDDVHRKLRVRAAHHGRSMEAEAREILAAAVNNVPINFSGLEEERQTMLVPSPATPAPSPARDGWQTLQDAIKANLAAHPKPTGEDAGLGAVDALLRDRRRDAMLEMIQAGDHPRDVTGANYADVLKGAGWSDADVDALWSRHRARGSG